MKILKTLEKYVLLTIIFFTPLLVLPFFADPFRTSKVSILVLGVSLALLIKCIRTFIKGELTISSGNFDFPIFFLGIVYLISGIFITPNKIEAFFIPGNAIIFVSLTLFYFLLNQSQIKEKKIKSTLFYSSLIFSLILILALSGILSKIPQLPAFMKLSTFNTEGALIPSLIFLASILPITIHSALEEKEFVKKIFTAVTSVFTVSAIILSLVNISSDKKIKIVLNSFQNSWIISMDSLKQNPLLGIGPGNYRTAFNLFRPVSYNATENWSIKFNSARNLYLTILTETGLMGLSASILLLIVSFQVIKKNLIKKKEISISLALCLILLGIFPSSTTLLLILYTLFSLNSEKKDFNINLTLKGQEGQKGSYFLTRILVGLITTPVVVGLIIFSLTAVKTLKAETKFKKAADSLAANNGKNTYDYLTEAIKLNPHVDRYRSSYSQVSFAIANSLARQENPSDKDKEMIAQLIQQSIQEGKAAVALNPTRSENWNNLAIIYRAIIPFAQGSDQFAIETFSQAVNLDPINPLTRISLGGIYYALGMYDQAIRVFELAVIAKPDYANAHYNLAVALREKGEIEKAIAQMEIVLSLVDKDSPDHDLAVKEIEALEAKKSLPVETAESKAENLVPPQPIEEPIIEPPLELPEEATPPISTP